MWRGRSSTPRLSSRSFSLFCCSLLSPKSSCSGRCSGGWTADTVLLKAGTRILEHSIAEGAIVFALVGWWLTARGLPSYVLPGPPEVLLTVARFFADPALLYHLGVSFGRVF